MSKNSKQEGFGFEDEGDNIFLRGRIERGKKIDQEILKAQEKNEQNNEIIDILDWNWTFSEDLVDLDAYIITKEDEMKEQYEYFDIEKYTRIYSLAKEMIDKARELSSLNSKDRLAEYLIKLINTNINVYIDLADEIFNITDSGDYRHNSLVNQIFNSNIGRKDFYELLIGVEQSLLVSEIFDLQKTFQSDSIRRNDRDQDDTE